MSPNVSSFVGDLVEMAKAFEELPQVKDELAQLKLTLDQRQDTIQSHEVRILELKADVEALHAKVRTTEVERDDAELRFLELDEKVANAVSLSKAVAANMGTLISQLDPPKPEPIPAPIPEVVHSLDPIVALSTDSPSTSAPSTVESTTNADTPVTEYHQSGYSDPLPTPAPSALTGTGTESEALSYNDSEPAKYDANGQTTDEWYRWHDRKYAF